MHGPARSPYQDLLRETYDALSPAVRIAHEAPLAAEGAMDVVHGDRFLTPLLVLLMKLPAQGTQLPVILHVSNASTGGHGGAVAMVWRRQIGATVLDTRQFVRAGRLIEQSGPGSVEFTLRVADHGSLQYDSTRCRFLGVPLPRLFAPRVRAQVSASDNGWHVAVKVHWRGHLVCRYGGGMRLSRTDAGEADCGSRIWRSRIPDPDPRFPPIPDP
jgi:hypothetical protein